jgi:hypothetical protein
MPQLRFPASTFQVLSVLKLRKRPSCAGTPKKSVGIVGKQRIRITGFDNANPVSGGFGSGLTAFSHGKLAARHTYVAVTCMYSFWQKGLMPLPPLSSSCFGVFSEQRLGLRDQVG